MTANTNDSVVEISIKDIPIPLFDSYEELLLCNLYGFPILGITDSSSIEIKDVTFSSSCYAAEYINGFLTTEICEEGGDRLLDILDFIPGVYILGNPANNILKLECKVFEVGKYNLELVYLQGNTIKIKEFEVNSKAENIHRFNINIENFGNGNYLLLLNTPNENTKYSGKFIIVK
jgi:hypothetical protein